MVSCNMGYCHFFSFLKEYQQMSTVLTNAPFSSISIDASLVIIHPKDTNDH